MSLMRRRMMLESVEDGPTIQSELIDKNLAFWRLKDKTSIKFNTTLSSTNYVFPKLTDISRLYDAYEMFSKCVNLEVADLRNLEAYNLKITTLMFGYCENLTEVIFGGNSFYYFSSIVSMFKNCSKLKRIDFSNVKETRIKYFEDVFLGCSSLNQIKCSIELKNFFIENQDTVSLPSAMREGGTGQWIIV